MKIYYFLINLPIAFALRSAIKMRDSSDITNAMKNQYLLKKVPYPELLNKIDHHEISKVYFSPKYDKVISENAEETSDIYTDFTFTDIIPPVSTSLIETSIKNNVETVFIKIQDPSPIQTMAVEVLNGVNNLFVPFIFISLLISFIRSLFLSRNNARNPFSGGMPGLPGSLKIDLEKDKELMKKSNITLTSFAGSPEIFEECTEVVSYLKN
jgi:ATP-dependent Zn protease